MKKIVAEKQKHKLNTNRFLKIVMKYSEMEELTLDILQKLIDKILIHNRKEFIGGSI